MTKTTPNDWLFFVDSDIKLAKEAFEEKIYHLACFHAQQAAEKLLKALLVIQDKPIPKLHSLQELYQRAVVLEPKLTDFSEKLIILDQYYIPTRYPDALPGSLPEGLPTEAHARQAIVDADELFALVQESLSTRQP